jgi:hypothetical protein
MFAVFALALLAEVGFVIVVFAAMFLSSAFGDSEAESEPRASWDVRASLSRIADLKVDPRADSSPTFRQLVENGFFDHWLDRQRGHS